MSFLKGLAISLLSFLLFLSLALFGVLFMLDKTLLDPEFVTTEINRLDVSSLAGEFFGIEASTDTSLLNKAINKSIADLEPWVKEEASILVHSSYDYFLGEAQGLSLTISTEPLKKTLKDNITETILNSPPPELKGMPPAVIKQYADQAYQQVAGFIPQTIEFTESSIPPDVMTTLEQVKSYLRYYQTAYYGLIGLMVLCALGIFLISRDVKHTSRSIGTTIAAYGVSGYAIAFALDYFNVEEQIMAMTDGIPPSLQTWMAQFMDNLLAPLETFALVLVIIGVILIVVSFVYRRRQAPAEE